MKIEPCDYCDFIGPFVYDEQQMRDFHRAWHELGRIATRTFALMFEAFSAIGRAARDAEGTFPALRLYSDETDASARREAVARQIAGAEARRMLWENRPLGPFIAPGDPDLTHH